MLTQRAAVMPRLANTLSRMLKPSAVFLVGSSAVFLAASKAANHAQKHDQEIISSFDRWRRKRTSWAQSWPEPVRSAHHVALPGLRLVSVPPALLLHTTCLSPLTMFLDRLLADHLGVLVHVQAFLAKAKLHV